MIIKPLLSNAATMSFSSRFDNDSINDNTHSQNTTLNTNTNTNTNEMPHHEIGSSFTNTNTDNTESNDDSQSHDQDSIDYHTHNDSSVADVTLSTIFKPEPHAVTLTQSIVQGPTQSNQYTMSTLSQQTSFLNNHHFNNSNRIATDTVTSTKPLSRRLSQHLNYPLVQPVVQSPSQIQLQLKQQQQMRQQQMQHEQQVKKMSNPVIALIAHDLLKFIEEENHYRVARENLKSDVLKIRQSRTRQSSAVRTHDTSERDRSSSKVNTNNYYYTNTSNNNANVSSASKPRARSSVSAFRNVSSNSVKPQYYHSQNQNSNSVFNSKPVANTYHKPSSAKPAPPAAHTIKNANELIDKLIYEVYAGK